VRGYFPAFYPGELLYSVLARYHLHIGSPGPMHLLDALFGNRKVIATFDLPGHLNDLSERIPSEYGLSTNRLIKKFTLFSYFTAFEPPSLQAKVRQAMLCGTIDGLHVRLGLAAFRVGRIRRLRFCPGCAREMQANYGELYWRRDHQLPSVVVCPEHACPLLQSEVVFTEHSRHKFVAATLDNCPSHARPIISVMESSNLSHLHRLACLSADLLNKPPEPRTFAAWTVFYRNKMVETGLSKSSITMDQHLFDEAFRCFYGATLEMFPNVMKSGDFPSDWLAAMVRKHRKAVHPLFHLLLQNFLDQRDRFKSPFGTGPWSCRNPLAKHRSSTPIKSITQHSNHGKTVGVFECTCGYAYTRFFDPGSGELGAPRFLHFGSLLEPALRKLVIKGTGLRETSRSLKIDPKTVVRLANDLRITVPWKQSSSKNEQCTLQKKIKRRLTKRSRHNAPLIQKHRRQKSNRPIHDWPKIDSAWVTQLKKLANCIIEEQPPIRITVAELERRAGLRGWLLKRRHRLPKAINLLNDIVENVDDFQLRRIRWAIDELEREGGPIKAWKVVRKAGLRSGNLERVKALLEEEPDFLRLVA